jgi:hypothetical protein
MRKISLTQGKSAIVDDGDFEWLNQHKWFARKEARGTQYNAARNSHGKKRHTILMHRFIMNAQKGEQIDHKNHNALDNHRNNLRFCTPSQNAQNRKIQRNKKSSRYKGVSWVNRDRCWVAAIKINQKTIFIGKFHNEIKAAKAYDKKARELFREFSYVNFKK